MFKSLFKFFYFQLQFLQYDQGVFAFLCFSSSFLFLEFSRPVILCTAPKTPDSDGIEHIFQILFYFKTFFFYNLMHPLTFYIATLLLKADVENIEIFIVTFRKTFPMTWE